MILDYFTIYYYYCYLLLYGSKTVELRWQGAERKKLAAPCSSSCQQMEYFIVLNNHKVPSYLAYVLYVYLLIWKVWCTFVFLPARRWKVILLPGRRSSSRNLALSIATSNQIVPQYDSATTMFQYGYGSGWCALLVGRRLKTCFLSSLLNRYLFFP